MPVSKTITTIGVNLGDTHRIESVTKSENFYQLFFSNRKLRVQQTCGYKLDAGCGSAALDLAKEIMKQFWREISKSSADLLADNKKINKKTPHQPCKLGFSIYPERFRCY